MTTAPTRVGAQDPAYRPSWPLPLAPADRDRRSAQRRRVAGPLAAGPLPASRRSAFHKHFDHPPRPPSPSNHAQDMLRQAQGRLSALPVVRGRCACRAGRSLETPARCENVSAACVCVPKCDTGHPPHTRGTPPRGRAVPWPVGLTQAPRRSGPQTAAKTRLDPKDTGAVHGGHASGG